MNIFKEIFPGVSEMLSDVPAPQIQAFLDPMLEEGIISKEYYQTLLHEKDIDDLARQIALTLLGKQAEQLNATCLQLPDSPRENAKNAAVSLRARNLTGDLIPAETPPETRRWDCLQSEVHPPLLGKLPEEMAEAPAVPATEAVGDDQDNPEVFYTVERDESGEVVCLCSDMGEAYNKIAALAEYLLKDQQDTPAAEEHFERLFSELAAAEGSGGCPGAKNRGSSSDAPEAKRQKLGHSPALCIVSGDPVTIPLNLGQDSTLFPPDFRLQILVATVGPAEVFGPSADTELWCFPRNASNIQMVFTFENAQPSPSPPGTPASPELVRAFCKRLKGCFCSEGHAAPRQPLGHLYLDGHLVRHRPDSRSGRSADLRLCNPGEKWETAVERGTLIQTLGRREPVVILGKAGMGKSLLTQKICLDWARGQMTQFDFVFRFDCRRLSLLRGSPCELKPLLLDSAAGLREGVDEAYERMLQTPERVLLLFDGVGELKDPDGKEAHGPGPILAALFQKKLLNGCTLLLTGRPKERLPQYFPRVDTVLEVVGFSAEQASLYLARYFEGCPLGEEKARLIRSCPYLFSHCCNPALCQVICEAVLGRRGEEELPSTLTGLFVIFLLHKLASSTARSVASKQQSLTALTELVWSLGQRGQNALFSDQFPSTDVKEFALKTGLMAEERGVCVFSSFGVQSFLVALHLTLAKEIKGKKLNKYLGLSSKSRKFLPSWCLVPHFLTGLLFLKDDLRSCFLLGKEGEPDTEKMVAKKQRSLSRFIRKLSVRDLSPDKLLQLLHCVRETEDQYLLNHLALELRPDLSFLGFPLTPSDAHVLHSVLRRSCKEFALDLRGSGIHGDGLRRLLDLKNVAKFRLPLGEAVALWKHLWESKERETLQKALEKFLLVAPFRAKTMKDVDALLNLVQLQREMAEGEDSAGSSGLLIPAIPGLLQLEFSLGPSCGLEGFQKLAESLAAFPALRYLDLDSPDENEIGDEGMRSLSSILPRLASLETLNVSRNKVTDLGAEPLARALPSLPLLKTLSLYKNCIGDAGAESFAEVLPRMSALRVFDLHCNKISAAGAQRLADCLRKCPCIRSMALWNSTIPHGVLDRLQQLDSRIRRF